MISIGICAALWEDKLRRTPGIIKRGYLTYEYQTVFHEQTHPRPGAAAAAAVSLYLIIHMKNIFLFSRHLLF